MIMRKKISNMRAKLLSKLPVSVARRCFKPAPHQPGPRSCATHQSQLLVDVSVIITHDFRTGIQRVVRALLLQLLSHPPAGWQVRPVFATRGHGYHYAPDHFGRLEGAPPASIESHPVLVQAGDLFLGLDLAAHLLPLHKAELAQWRQAGVSIHIVVYDLLPVLHPHWFNPKTTRNFHRWLRTIAIFTDSIICISNSVKTEINDWLCKKYSLTAGALPISVIPLGADIEASGPSRGMPDNIDQLLSAIDDKPTVLMVGTIEPRKGHDEVLAAIEILWQRGHDINFIIIGKPGWKTDILQRSLLNHPRNQTSLYWFGNASDELLSLLYARCAGVIVASHAEGFGLPLAEAVGFGKRVLARDIPIFREIAKPEFVTFFKESKPEVLANSIANWLTDKREFVPHCSNVITWNESASNLVQSLLGLRGAA